MSRRALMVMAKEPEPGRTKTRLCPPLTAAQAADLYASFLRDVLARVGSLMDVEPFVALTPAGASPYFRTIAPTFGQVVQEGPTLGRRLAHVLGQGLAAGYEQVAAINSDGPTLPTAYLQAAFETLDRPEIDVVLGPCDDGGYYLIGWKNYHPAMVEEVQMSTPRVLADSLAVAARLGLAVKLLPPWYDVDDVADLQRLWHELQADPERAPATWATLTALQAALPIGPPPQL